MIWDFVGNLDVAGLLPEINYMLLDMGKNKLKESQARKQMVDYITRRLRSEHETDIKVDESGKIFKLVDGKYMDYTDNELTHMMNQMASELPL